jgi:hypothetical protein
MNKSKKNKLHLTSETIMPMQSRELEGVYGAGTPVAASAASSAACVRVSIAAGKSSARCAQGAASAIANGGAWAKKKIGISW